MLYEDIFRSLQEREIKYLLIGGIAVNLHGFSRATSDLDLLLAMDDANLVAFVQILEEGGWQPRVPVPLARLADRDARIDWIENKGMRAFTVLNPSRPMEEIDILLHSGINFGEAFQRRQVLSAENIEISLMALEDLMTMKEQAGRPRDLIDLQALEEIKKIHGQRDSSSS